MSTPSTKDQLAAAQAELALAQLRIATLEADAGLAQQRIATLEGANTTLRVRLVGVRLRAHRLAAVHAGRRAQAKAAAKAKAKAKPARPARVVPQDELDRVQKMAIAKAKAMASGVSAKV